MNQLQKKFILTGAIVTIITAAILAFIKRKKFKKLLIVGNGFDLYHGISSSYLQFRDYVQQHDSDVYDTLEKYLYLQTDDEWSRFEANLANLDADELLDNMKKYLGDPSGDSASTYHEYQYQVGKVTDNLSDKMQSLFLNWVLQLDILHQSARPKLMLPKNQLYLNFNYTNSLEKLYAIPEKNILYIHGKAKDLNSLIVLGHGWENYTEATKPKPITYEDFVDGNYATEEDWQYTEAKQYIEQYFEAGVLQSLIA